MQNALHFMLHCALHCTSNCTSLALRNCGAQKGHTLNFSLFIEQLVLPAWDYQILQVHENCTKKSITKIACLRFLFSSFLRRACPLHCTLYYTTLHYSVLHYTLHYTVLHTPLHSTLQCTPYYTVLHTALYSISHCTP